MSTATPNGHIIEVTIAGMPLKLRSSHDDPTVQELVSFVNRRIQDSLSHVKNGNLQLAAVLTALNLAEELLLLKKQAAQELDRLESKTDRIITSLETARIPKSTEAQIGAQA